MKERMRFIITVLIQVIIISACKKDAGNGVLPDITVSNSALSIAEDSPVTYIEIPVTLSVKSDKQVTVNYSTEDSTAVAGKDYEAVTAGNLTFLPGETSGVIKVNIIPDTASKQDVFFKVKLSSPVNATLNGTGLTIKIVNVDYANLVWSDEFTNGPLNTTYWNYEQGATGWGNNELENYTNSINNVHIDSGYLHISALNTSSNYTSGRITTKGKKEFTYGRVDIRAKLPEGNGIWPALWMLGSNIGTAGWPKCGEIDIMELIGKDPSTVYGTVHWNDNGHVSRGGSSSLTNGKYSSGFHIFSLTWTPNRLIWLIDNQQFCYVNRSTISVFPFDLPQFFIFNVAVGGNWPGPPDQTTVFPQSMIIDYIRVYQ
jgi:hypothetical protein